MAIIAIIFLSNDIFAAYRGFFPGFASLATAEKDVVELVQ
jgi:hypothetical protein